MKKAVLIVICALLFSSVLFAKGKRDNEVRDVGAQNSWQESFSLEDKKPGTYNVLITAEDLGGNSSTVGPFNIAVDPESDLPVTGITNPPAEMRVPGNLNIVGTCIDDDAVQKVEIYFDGKEDKTIIAEGKEFWSYYLDTTKMEEGVHTITVTGIDINGTRGHSVTTKWHLDRKMPVTEVQNHGLGELVSGKISLQGEVSDGNGIRELFYSIDGGKNFLPVKLKENKKEKRYTFNITIDTKKLEDGPQVCWFRATDKQGTQGTSSFLYFVDNTKPQITLLYPGDGETVNGIFSVAGSAYDRIGIEKLTWALGKQSGEFELTDGNPYWVHEFDIRGETAKTQELVITATDVAGNVTEFKKKLVVDLESDKPVIQLAQPSHDFSLTKENDVFVEDSFFVRGQITDDDGVASLHWKIDTMETFEEASEGVFYVDVLSHITNPLSAGIHKITLWATDVHGIKGNEVVVPFVVKGASPVFCAQNDVKVKTKTPVTEETVYEPGMELNSEGNTSLAGSVSSECGLSAIRWTFNGQHGGEILLKNVKGNTNFDINLADAPWGLVETVVTAEDLYGRTTEQRYLVYRTDFTTVRVGSIGKPKVLFDDCFASGFAELQVGQTVSGYFVGGTASEVTIEPENEFVTAKLNGNTILLTAQKAAGRSEGFRITVTTDTGVTASSEELKVYIAEEKPGLKLDARSVFDGKKPVVVTGKATLPAVAAEESVLKVQYRVFESPVEPAVVAEGETKPEPSLKTVEVAEDGTFTIEIPAKNFKEGVYVIEVIAKSSHSEPIADAAFVKVMTPIPEPDLEADPKAKKTVAAPAAFNWIRGENLYYTCYYQDEFALTGVTANGVVLFSKDNSAVTPETVPPYLVKAGGRAKTYEWGGMIPAELLTPGTVNAEVKVANSADKLFTSKFSAKTLGQPEIAIDSINGTAFVNGLVYELPAAVTKERTDVLRVVIESVLPVVDTSYTITGEQNSAFGSPKAVEETGKLTLKKVVDESGIAVAGKKPGSVQYEAFITLKGYPAERTHITVSAATDKENPVAVRGTVHFVRSAPDSGIENKIQPYWRFDRKPDAAGIYTLNKGETLATFINVPQKYSIELKDAEQYNGGVKVQQHGSVVTVEAVNEGVFENIVISITDRDGIMYETEPVTIRGDWKHPALKFISPSEQQWLQATLPLAVEASDGNGLSSVEYSLNNGKTWNVLELADEQIENQFGGNIDLSSLEDGLVCVDVRAIDTAGKETVIRRSVFKDTTPPEVITVTPAKGHVVNGETRVVLLVKDNGRLVKGLYVYPKEALAEAKEKLNASQAAIATHAETEEGTEVSEEEVELLTYKNNISPLSALDSLVSFTQDLKLNSSVSIMVGKNSVPIGDDMRFEFTDASGNQRIYDEKEYQIDAESDKPVIEIHLPAENAIETTDFVVSGIVYDDDGDSRVWYKIDDGEFTVLKDWGTSWSIPVALHSLTDNEHTITVYAEDQFGVAGNPVTRKVRVSLEEPFGRVDTPTFEETVRGRIKLTGITSDKNGISKVQVSVDNDNTWQTVSGLEAWEYEFDTRVVQDGTHVVFLKVWDDYGVQGLYSSLINIDNTTPEIKLELPLDDSTFTTNNIFLSGQTTDNIGLKKLYVRVRHLGENTEPIPEHIAYKELEVLDIINESIDITGLENGAYNLEVSGEDSAGNVTRVSRNIQVDNKGEVAHINLLYPMNGENIQGDFNLYGNIISEIPVEKVSLLVDGKEVDIVPVNMSGYFKFKLSPENLLPGEHIYSVRCALPNGKMLYSVEQFLKYTPAGPWVTIDNFAMGDFAIDRPYIEGRAGYMLTEAEVLMLKDKDADKLERARLRDKAVESIEISFDNGKTFTKIGSKEQWRYRVENGEMADGYHFLVIRATMKNGETAVTRSIIQIDKTAPTIKLISPGEGGRYNQALDVSGLSNDDVVLKNVTLELRQGDKANYEMPAFIEGLYIDGAFWGNTLFSAGAGLTFYDDNVKLQLQYGQMTQKQFDMLHSLFNKAPEPLRYGGSVIGLKLLANVGNVPFSYLFGPDWTWLSAAFTVGANFSYFTVTQADKPQVLSAVLAQIEFPRITMEKRKMFRTLSFYTEGQIWSIPTDIKSAEGAPKVKPLVPQISFGVRMSVF